MNATLSRLALRALVGQRRGLVLVALPTLLVLLAAVVRPLPGEPVSARLILVEVGLAVVQLKADHEATEAELIDYCRGKLASFKVPRYVEFVTEYPLTPAGKVKKFVLQDAYAKSMDLKGYGPTA